MTVLVLVHGAWHGGWVWKRLTPHLRSRGYHVLTPTLPGADSQTGVGLRDQVRALRALLALQVAPVVLAHSYAGLVAREVAAGIPHQVERLVLIDAWIAANGQSLLDLAPPWFVDWCASQVTGEGRARFISPPPPALFGVVDLDDLRWLDQRLRPQPWATFAEPTSLNPAITEIAGTAIVCDPPSMPFAELAAAAGYPIQRISSGHDVMLTNPARLASLLETLISAPPT